MSGIVAYHNDWIIGTQDNTEGTDETSASGFFAKFSSPWRSYSTQSSLTQIQQAVKFAHFLWKYDPTYQQAIQRVVSYFLTDLEFFDPTYQGNLKDEDIRGYRELLEDQLNLKASLQQVLLNYCVYGNVIMAILPPLRRTLQCPACGMVHPIGVVTAPENKSFKFKYHSQSVKFEATCQICKSRGFWKVNDVKDDFRRNARISLYDLRHFTIQCDPFTDKRVYTWTIPAWIKRDIQNSDSLALASTPISILKAIGKDKAYTFNSDVLLHLRKPDLVGMQTGGWGIPQALYCYGAARYTFGLRKMNEILSADYMIPLRLMSPAQDKMSNAAIGAGPFRDMSDFNSRMRSVWLNHRRDPASVHTIDFPIEYQILGAEGKNLVPGELLVQGEDMQLNATGIPPQFYRGDLNIQTAPMSARLFESHWQHVPDAGNTFLRWVVRKVSDELGWKPLGVRLAKPRIADNMDQLMLLLQLLPTGKISDTTILQQLGRDFTEELRRRKDDEIRFIQNDVDIQQEADKIVAGTSVLQQAVEEQRAMTAPQQGGGAAMPAGQPPADPVAQIMARIQAFGNPQTPAPITEQYQIAQEAAALFANMPEVEKRQKLREIDQINKPLADLIRSQMGEVHKQQKQEFAAQGEAMMQQQQSTGRPM